MWVLLTASMACTSAPGLDAGPRDSSPIDQGDAEPLEGGSPLDGGTPGRDWSILTRDPPFGYRVNHGFIAYAGRLYVIAGRRGPGSLEQDVWAYDGFRWSQLTARASFGPRASFLTAVFDNKMWVIGGASSFGPDVGQTTWAHDVWWSTDGVTWTKASDNIDASSYSWCAAVFNGELWLADRRNRLHSTDGISWSHSTQDLLPGSSLGCFVSAGKLWVVGYEGEGSRVYSSPDGVSYTLETQTPEFGPRTLFPLAVLNGTVFLVGAAGPELRVNNDVWSSTDGRMWTAVTPSAPWRGGYYDRVAVFQNAIWLTAALAEGGSAVWHSP